MIFPYDMMTNIHPSSRPQERADKGHESAATDDNAGLNSSETAEVPASRYYPTQLFARLKRLGHEWTFPSDHLPIAAAVGDLKICSFNVLNAQWVKFFESDNEGLAKSRIVADHVPLEGGSWTRREDDVLKIICGLAVEMGLILLQECSQEFLARLATAIPDAVQLFPGRLDNPENQIACLVNSERVTLKVEKSSFSVPAFACRKDYSAMNLSLSTQDGTEYQVFHAHVPGSPNHPGLAEWAQFILANQNPRVVRIAAGDMNFSFRVVESVFKGAGLPSFNRLVQGNTSIGASGGMPIAKDIDHILLFGDQHSGYPLELGTLSEETAVARLLINSQIPSLAGQAFGSRRNSG